MNVYMDTEAKIVKVDCLNIASNECKEPVVVASLGQLIISSEFNFVPFPFARGDKLVRIKSVYEWGNLFYTVKFIPLSLCRRIPWN